MKFVLLLTYICENQNTKYLIMPFHFLLNIHNLVSHMIAI